MLMLPTTIRSPPSLGAYIPLEQHQARTPESFFDGKPVLHYHAVGATARIPKSQCGILPMFPADIVADADQREEEDSRGDEGDGNGEDGEAEEEVPGYAVEELVERKIDVLVESENLVLFSTEAECGVQIPYPTIALHAKQPTTVDGAERIAIYMQLEFHSGDDQEDDPVELTLLLPLPAPATAEAATTADADADATGQPPSEGARVDRFFAALSACQELHPDPAEDDEEDEFGRIIFESGGQVIDGISGAYSWEDGESGGLPPPMPGSAGWITAENIHEYFDEDGNWLRDQEGAEGAEEADEGDGGDGENGGGEAGAVHGELGEGAGRVRGRDEVDQAEAAVDGGPNGTEQSDVDTKKPRIE